MSSIESCLSYSVSVFIVVLVTSCIVNLLDKHYILQLTGIAFFSVYFFFESVSLMKEFNGLDNLQFYQALLSTAAGISACLVSMLMGFLVFPRIRNRFNS